MYRALALFLLSLHSPRPDLAHTSAIWANKLSLADWHVSITTVGCDEIGDAILGDITWDVRTKSARIRVLREEDYDLPRRLARRDQEATVVHELVHLRRAISPDMKSTHDEEDVMVETGGLLRRNHNWLSLAVME